MVILTNFEGFPSPWSARNGLSGESRFVRSPFEVLKSGVSDADSLALINCDPRFTYELAASCLIRRRKIPIVAVDLVLRRPKSIRSWLFQPVRRVLLNRVDYFVHYFKDVSGYREIFGIDENRSSFVPFKANLLPFVSGESTSEGTYVTCLGRTLRDFDTFFNAIETLPYPGAISRPDFKAMEEHGSRFTRSMRDLPENVRVLDDDGSNEAVANILRASKIVVLPILKESMAASGSSICLNAMLFKRCVIGTEGPGFSDVFQHGEVVCVPPEDPTALARAIQEIWLDDDKRKRIALAGYQYALNAGDSQALFQRVLDRVGNWYCTAYRPHGKRCN